MCPRAVTEPLLGLLLLVAGGPLQAQLDSLSAYQMPKTVEHLDSRYFRLGLAYQTLFGTGASVSGNADLRFTDETKTGMAFWLRGALRSNRWLDFTFSVGFRSTDRELTEQVTDSLGNPVGDAALTTFRYRQLPGTVGLQFNALDYWVQPYVAMNLGGYVNLGTREGDATLKEPEGPGGYIIEPRLGVAFTLPQKLVFFAEGTYSSTSVATTDTWGIAVGAYYQFSGRAARAKKPARPLPDPAPPAPAQP